MRKYVLVAATALLASAGSSSAQVQNDDKTIAIGGRIDNTSFARDKLEIGNRLMYWAPVFETLLTIMPDGKIAPNLATEWSYNDDNTVLTLKLREGVKFTDGTPFDAEAVKANLEALRTGTGQNVWMVNTIDSYEIVSPAEIRIKLKEPDPALVRDLTLVAGAIAAPSSLGTEQGAKVPVGTGPYLYDANLSVPGRQYVYERNPDYWNPDAIHYERMTLTPMTDLTARVNALKSGQIDVAPAEPQSVKDAEASGLKVTRNPVNWQGFIIADRDGTTNPALKDLRVRQALNMAFDGASILKFVEQGYGIVSDQIFASTSEAYLPELDDYYPYDPEKARALLKEAGYGEGLTLKLPQSSGFAVYDPIIEQQLKDVGIAVEWVKVAPDALISELTAGKHGIFFFRLGNQADWGDLKKLAFPNSAWNPLHTNDPKLLELLKNVQTAKTADQKAAFQAVNRYLVENAWFVPWYRLDSINLMTADVEEMPIPGNVMTFPLNYRPAAK